MKVTTILFDLDGTLLQMEHENFIKHYFGGLVKALIPYGYDKDALIKGIWTGTEAMIRNNGDKTNEEVFWQTFSQICGEKVYSDAPAFDKFYDEEFDKVSVVSEKSELIPKVVDEIKKMGFRLVLATNPVFPAIATQKRARWAGLSVDDFELYTTYENSRFSKPNLNYYKEILAKIGAKPEECLMVGNDVSDDMVAEQLGMKVFLITKHLINKDNVDISRYPNGDFNDLLNYIKAL